MATPPIPKKRCRNTKTGVIKFLTPRTIAKPFFSQKGWVVEDVGAIAEVAKPVEIITPEIPEELIPPKEEIPKDIKITEVKAPTPEPVPEAIKNSKRVEIEIDHIDYDDITKTELTQLLKEFKIKYNPNDKKKVLYDLYINR